MKKLKLLLALSTLCVALLFAQSAIAETCCEQTEDLFPDVEIGHEYYDQINYLKREGIFMGSTDGNFYPDSTLNRAEFAAIVVRLSGATPTVEEYNNCFPDVTDDWYAASVCYAKAQGWIHGYSGGEEAGTYGPANDVMDIEVLVILSQFNNWEMEEGGEWYEPALNYALAANIYDAPDPILDIDRDKTADIIFRDLASTSLGFAEYSDDLKDDLYEHSIEELIEVEEVPVDETSPDEVIIEEETGEILWEEGYEESRMMEDDLLADYLESCYDKAFVGEPGMPQIIPTSAVFNPEATEITVTMGMQSVHGEDTVNITEVEVLFFHGGTQEWTNGRNSDFGSVTLEATNVDDFADNYSIVVDELYNPESGEAEPFILTDPSKGFLFKVKTDDGMEYIVGDDDVNDLDPTDMQNIADETTPNNLGDDIEEKKCPPVDVLGALQGAFTAEGVSVDTSNLDTSNFQSPMECGNSVSSTIRLDHDLEVLPSHEEIARRVAAGDIPEGGFKVANYLLVFSIWSYCNTQTWECEVILSYQLIEAQSGVVIEAGYEGYFDKDNLQGEFGKMLGETEAAVNENEGSSNQLH